MHGDQLPIKQYQMHTTLKIHGKNNLTMILPKSWQDLSKIFQVPGNLARFTNVGTSEFNSYIGVTHP